jgi:hypothetical protein
MSYDQDELAKQAASAMGRKGGMAKSEKKTAACRANAKLPRSKGAREWAALLSRSTPSAAERKARRKAARAARRLNR